ncbi:MAG: BON domain-containing protein [Piscirickettsiaceae bacterium]|nr:MAG: BON domain-containing protein [Piscirickettsiaceae bacterium]
MTHTFKILALTFLTITLLSGCAAVVVGGATTGVAIVHDRRTTGTVIDDQGIEFKSLYALYSDPSIRNNTHINVTSYNGILLLTGEAPNEDLRNKIVTKLSRIQKVRTVHNNITLAAPSSLVSRSSDTLITSKAKISLFNINGLKGFDPTRVKIITENGVVYLLGILREHESQAVIETTRRVGGVQRVVKLFEIIS